MPKHPQVILRDPSLEADRRLSFDGLVDILQADSVDEVLSTLNAVETYVNRGFWAVGFLTYESAPAFDAALAVHPKNSLPSAWFAVFETMRPVDPLTPGPFTLDSFASSISPDDYRRSIDRIKEYIASGHTYQVNYTYPLKANFEGDPLGLFLKLCRAQPVPLGLFINTGRHAICSVSPELFFRLNGRSIVCRPMKGTNQRGLTLDEDRLNQQALACSEKDRAENAMIVDMVRNDLGRIARPGSVCVESLFEVERYPTVYQMTSTVRAETEASVPEIFRALFPCASITGAPKVRTMQIIRDLEPEPRGLYTGCVGYWGPDRQAHFNVAIRTLVVDQVARQAVYGVGGGIVWDSQPEAEYAESRTKARVLLNDPPSFDLLESILWTPSAGYWLMDRHLRRLTDSAEYFGFKIDLDKIENQLIDFARTLDPVDHKARLCVARDGAVTINALPIEPQPADRLWKLAIARDPIDPDNPFLYHKTTNRVVYDSACADCEGYDDLVLWNGFGEITETRIGNIVVEKNGERLTPPISSGLLPGVYRACLLEQNQLREKALTFDDLKNADSIYMINSVRGRLQSILLNISSFVS